LAKETIAILLLTILASHIVELTPNKERQELMLIIKYIIKFNHQKRLSKNKATGFIEDS
jgi:hypothetical protein